MPKTKDTQFTRRSESSDVCQNSCHGNLTILFIRINEVVEKRRANTRKCYGLIRRYSDVSNYSINSCLSK